MFQLFTQSQVFSQIETLQPGTESQATKNHSLSVPGSVASICENTSALRKRWYHASGLAPRRSITRGGVAQLAARESQATSCTCSAYKKYLWGVL